MKLSLTKYCIVSSLLVVFLLRGLETALPLFAGYFTEQNRQEMEANNDAKNNGGKVEEKLAEKEFLSHFLDDCTSNAQFTLPSIYLPVRNSTLLRQIFLPVFTPPPEFIG